MSRSRRWSPGLAALFASAAIVFAACGGAAQSTAPSSAPGSEAPSAAPSTGAFEAMTYPTEGEAPCGQADAPDAEHSAYT